MQIESKLQTIQTADKGDCEDVCFLIEWSWLVFGNCFAKFYWSFHPWLFFQTEKKEEQGPDRNPQTRKSNSSILSPEPVTGIRNSESENLNPESTNQSTGKKQVICNSAEVYIWPL